MRQFKRATAIGLVFSLGLYGVANSQTVLKVEATAQAPTPETGYFNMGTSRSPDGHTITLNNRYLMKDGQPWLPVMGEFHFTRYPAQYWEDEIVKMKSAGVDIIATYVIWVHHEEKPGQFNWSGDRDIKRFIDLCAKHGMKVVLRVGPWAHGEVRYGGTPEWVVEQVPTRRNDPAYLHYVERYWGQLALQVKGDFWKDGGPIIGIQLENEYNLTGPGMGAEHIETLKKLALSLGMDAPLYTVTGWDGTTYPKREVTPVFGGYMDEPWGRGATRMAPNEVYTFRFNSRVAGDAGAQTVASTRGTAVTEMDHTPFLGAEYAGGLPIMYRRRPLVAPDDIGAMWPVQLGSGVNLYGYYMFHGGRNPQGAGRLEENGLLGAYNDLPLINYDFQAPYGQYGESHPVLNTIRPYHMFVSAFGDRLAPMSVHAPVQSPTGRNDFSTPRFSVRSKGDRGFVFMSNYIRQYPMTAQKDIQFDITLPGGALKFPSTPITVPTGAYFIWPFNFDLDGVNLTYATAQPVTRIETAPGHVTYVFVAENGIVPEMAFPKTTKISGIATHKSGELTLISPKASNGIVATVKSAAKTIDIIVLSQADAKQLWIGDVAGQKRLILTPDEVSFGSDGLELRSMGDANFKLGVYPTFDVRPKADLPLALAKTTGVFQTFFASAQPKTITATITQTREAGIAPPIKIGGTANRALQPNPEAFGATAAWSISLPSDALDGVADAFLKIDYQGDIARLFSDADMLDDEYFYGPAWTIGLKRFKSEIAHPLTLTVMPLRKDAPIYLDDAVKAKLPDTDQIARVNGVTVVPQYALKITY